MLTDWIWVAFGVVATALVLRSFPRLLHTRYVKRLAAQVRKLQRDPHMVGEELRRSTAEEVATIAILNATRCDMSFEIGIVSERTAFRYWGGTLCNPLRNEGGRPIWWQSRMSTGDMLGVVFSTESCLAIARHILHQGNSTLPASLLNDAAKNGMHAERGLYANVAPEIDERALVITGLSRGCRNIASVADLIYEVMRDYREEIRELKELLLTQPLTVEIEREAGRPYIVLRQTLSPEQMHEFVNGRERFTKASTEYLRQAYPELAKDILPSLNTA